MYPNRMKLIKQDMNNGKRVAENVKSIYATDIKNWHKLLIWKPKKNISLNKSIESIHQRSVYCHQIIWIKSES